MPNNTEKPARQRPFAEVFLERLATSASVKTIYGEPITAHGKTIVPVARVAYGFGLGSGVANLRLKLKAGAEPGGPSGDAGGGGVVVQPVGALEITPASTRFVRYRQRPLVLADLAIGILADTLFCRRRR